MNLSIVNASLMACPLENGFTKAIRKTFTGGYWPLAPGTPTFNQDLIKLVQTVKPDVVFLQIQAPGILQDDTAQEIAKHSFVMNWSGDIRVESPPQWYLEIGKLIHLSTFSNMKDVRGCLNLGIASDWLEIGFDPEKYRKWEVPLMAPDIVAHFNDYGIGYFPLSGYRQEIVKALSEEFGTKFGVFGNIKGARGNFNNDQIMESKNYAGAKIAINCSHFCTERYSSDRLLRILGSGTMCLTHAFPEIEKMYEVNKHLVTFDTIEDLVEKCHFYLGEDFMRNTIAHGGHKHALENYTFDHMANNIQKLYYEYRKDLL